MKIAEHPLGLARLALRRADIVHVQWMTIPEIDRWLLRTRAPMVYTAHDMSDRRTGEKRATWTALYDRFRARRRPQRVGRARRWPSSGSTRRSCA